MISTKKHIGIMLAVCCAGAAMADAELPSAPVADLSSPSSLSQTAPAAGSTEGGVELTAPGQAGIPYFEYFNYSSYAKRSYVPGYTPHPTSLYENPRDYPWSLCVMGKPYHTYAGMTGWHFNSPHGNTPRLDPKSHDMKYYRGELGITKDLRGGYPQGMRVIEDAIVPVSSSSERGGIFIQGGGTDIIQTTTVDAESEVPNMMPPPPRPVPTPESLEK